jgi:hypothetical protein
VLTTTSGSRRPVALTADDAYWITARDARDLHWTRADGSIHQHMFGRLRSSGVFQGRARGDEGTDAGEDTRLPG